MFKKKPNIKALSPIRSSDRRKIADQIITAFEIETPATESTNVDEHETATAASGLGDLRNSLLPESSLSARFTTTAGPKLSPVSGTVYVGAFESQEQRVLWFKIDEKLIPTVYTLWRHPGLVPLLHTPELVLQKLRTGADLMTPGLARGPPFPSKARKNSIVAIASIEKPSVPRVVGECDIDVASLRQVQGAKGRAVRGHHWEGDEIWAWSQGGKPGGEAPHTIDGWDLEAESEELNERVDDLSMGEQDDDGGVLLDSQADLAPKGTSRNEFLEGEDASAEEAKAPEKEMTTKEIDEAFWDAFLFGCQRQHTNHKDEPSCGLNFPIPQSLVISNLVLPYLPIWTPSQAASLQIKKTRWKNTKKFIWALDKQKILKAKDRDGGETVVLDIEFNCTPIKSFVPYRLPKKETLVVGSASAGGAGSGGTAGASTASGDPSVGQQLSKLNLLKPPEKLSPLFKASNANPRQLYLAAELRPITMSYIESENLILPNNKRLVKLDPLLSNSVFDGKSANDSEAHAKGTVPRDVLVDRVIETCQPFWALLRNDESRETAKAKAGKMPKIQIKYETRSGNKTVTKISGVEVFHISPQPLADELQKACASSTSVGHLVGSSPKNPVQEVMVQGPQRDIVMKALEQRGVSKQWIEFADKTKGGKKAKSGG